MKRVGLVHFFFFILASETLNEMDPPSLSSLSSLSADKLTPQSSTSSFASDASTGSGSGSGTPKPSHAAITDALLALLPSAALKAAVPAPPSPASSSSSSLVPVPVLAAAADASASAKKAVRFADPLVAFCIAQAVADVDLDAVSDDEEGDGDEFAVEADADVGADEFAGPSGADVLSDDEADTDVFSDGEADVFSDTEPTEEGAVRSPRRGLVRATRRPISHAESLRKHKPVVDELDKLNKIKKKGILKTPTQPADKPLLDQNLQPSPRKSRSALVALALNSPSATQNPPSPKLSVASPSSSSTQTATTPPKKRTQVTKARFEQGAMFVNF
ncbi:UNVERIFIED_CONTAM: hypothetical protein HDU68_009837 [Siphonaria sp. JEL0065]|nr:hypothetical protein HDU68_009837 [Siphonaria sp. JEL0065]